MTQKVGQRGRLGEGCEGDPIVSSLSSDLRSSCTLKCCLSDYLVGSHGDCCCVVISHSKCWMSLTLVAKCDLVGCVNVFQGLACIYYVFDERFLKIAARHVSFV